MTERDRLFCLSIPTTSLASNNLDQLLTNLVIPYYTLTRSNILISTAVFLMPIRKTSSISRVTKKYQATIPQAAREVLGITQGDCVAFEVHSGQVVLKKVSPLDWDYLNAVSGTMSEWTSAADEQAYRDL